MNVLATNNYLLQLPESWNSGAAVVVAGPGGDTPPFMVSIQTRPAPEGASAEQIGEEQLAGLSAQQNPVEVLSAGPLTLANCAGFEIHSRWPGKEGKAYHQQQLVVVHNRAAFFLLTSLPEEQFAKAKAEIEKIFRSFQILE